MSSSLALLQHRGLSGASAIPSACGSLINTSSRPSVSTPALSRSALRFMKPTPSLQRGFSSGESLRHPLLSHLFVAVICFSSILCVHLLSVSSRITDSKFWRASSRPCSSPIYPKKPAHDKPTNMPGTDKCAWEESFTIASLLCKNLHYFLNSSVHKEQFFLSKPVAQICNAEFFSFHLSYCLNLSKLAFLQTLTCDIAFKG